MINFNVGNKSYSNNQYSNKTAGDHVYYIKRTNLGVTDSSFNIIDHGNNLPITVSLMVINSELPKDSTYVEVYLKIHNNTLSSMNLENVVTVDTSNIFLYVSSYNTLESFALVSYEIIEDHLANASILVPGSFISSEDKSIDLLNNNGESNKYIMDGQWYKEWLAPLQSINILNRNLVSFPLGSTFALVRANEDVENAIGAGLNAVINFEFILNDSTILISGGQNYNINDTFTIDDGNASEPGIIEITEVDDNGAIIETNIADFGVGFTMTPNVTYNGSTGSDCDIVINDSYGVSINVTDGGNGYSSQDYLAVQYPGSDIFNPLKAQNIFIDPDTGNASEATFEIKPYIIPFEPLLNNAFSIDTLEIIDPGFNHKENPLVTLVNKQTKTLINNTYINSNSNNFIDITETL